jgi:predicted deacylase
VQEGDHLATIGTVDGTHEFPVLSRKSGVVVGRSNMPFVHEGDALFHVAYSEGDEPDAPDLADYQVDLNQPFVLGEEP